MLGRPGQCGACMGAKATAQCIMAAAQGVTAMPLHSCTAGRCRTTGTAGQRVTLRNSVLVDLDYGIYHWAS